jgi:hypothetical protein
VAQIRIELHGAQLVFSHWKSVFLVLEEAVQSGEACRTLCCPQCRFSDRRWLNDGGFAEVSGTGLTLFYFDVRLIHVGTNLYTNNLDLTAYFTKNNGPGWFVQCT